MSAALADGVLAIVKAATEPLYERIKALEAVIVELQAREPVPGPMGPAGPQGEKGEPGERGERGEQGEKGERGEPGAQGIQGEKGDRGEQGERGERGEPGLVGEKGDRGEPGERGPQGEQGERGDRGPDGLKGDSGVAGRDGVGVAGALIDRDGALTLTLSDGTTKPLGVVVGAKGEPGRDGVNGRDGVGFDDLEESYEDDGRVLVRKFLKGGEVVKEFRHVTSQPVFRDVWREGVTYTKGDLVQWDGSGFIALVDAPPMKPGTGKPEVTGWKLWIKRGNQGKEGRPGPQGPQGVKGDKGDRGPERWS